MFMADSDVRYLCEKQNAWKLGKIFWSRYGK